MKSSSSLQLQQQQSPSKNIVEEELEDGNEIIKNGTYVLIQRADQERILEFKEDASLYYGKGFNFQEIKLKNMLGCPFYSIFKIITSNEKRKGKDGKHAGQLCHLELTTNGFEQLDFASTANKLNVSTSGKDNRSIFDDGKSQSLGATDIAMLREQGISGREILDQLVSSSKTFNQKTEFSQEKYLKKKEKLYGDTLVVLKPTLNLIADHYFKRDPSKIMNLRVDSLSQMLSYSNVHSNGSYMIYETGCFGLVIASVLQRLGGNGLALHVHAGSTPQRQALYYMNFNQEELEPLKSLDVFYMIRPPKSSGTSSLSEPDSESKVVEDNGSNSTSTEPEVKKLKLEEVSKPKIQERDNENSITADEDLDQNDEETKPKFVCGINRLENERSALLLQTTEFDGLIICAKEHPLSIFQRLIIHLASSSPFVIFCQYSEPLTECYNWIKESNLGINVNLIENWFRTIQVETERTHPEINMSSNGGFLLYGISVKATATS